MPAREGGRERARFWGGGGIVCGAVWEAGTDPWARARAATWRGCARCVGVRVSHPRSSPAPPPPAASYGTGVCVCRSHGACASDTTRLPRQSRRDAAGVLPAEGSLQGNRLEEEEEEEESPSGGAALPCRTHHALWHSAVAACICLRFSIVFVRSCIC